MTSLLRFLVFFNILLLTLPNKHYSQLDDFGFGNYFSGSRDFIEISYGIGNLDRNNLGSIFNDLSQNEIILGRRFIKPIARYDLIQFSDNYLFSSYVSDYQNNSDGIQKISFDIWKFGLGYRKGYGYNWRSLGILPYYHTGFSWSKINLNPASGRSERNVNLNSLNLHFYDDEIKFGTSNIGGVDFRISSIFDVGASYETLVIFPYHKFWKQFGSFFIETLSQSGLDFLTEGVLIKAAPSITPLLYFVLKNGLSYYFFTLKQEDMNWPFNTTAPLTMEAFKISVKISF